MEARQLAASAKLQAGRRAPRWKRWKQTSSQELAASASLLGSRLAPHLAQLLQKYSRQQRLASARRRLKRRMSVSDQIQLSMARQSSSACRSQMPSSSAQLRLRGSAQTAHDSR